MPRSQLCCENPLELYPLRSVSANANPHNLIIAMRRILSPGGVDETLRNCEEDKGTYRIPSNEDQATLFQYQWGLEPLTQLSHFTQNSKRIVHEELFMAKVTLQSLAAPFFVMNANLSAMTGSRHVKDLTVRLLARIDITQQVLVGFPI